MAGELCCCFFGVGLIRVGGNCIGLVRITSCLFVLV